MLQERSLYLLNSSTRQKMRKRVVLEFLKEEPGTGKKDLSSKYNYFVETLRSGNRIFLSRPAIFNYGFDFVIRVEGINFDVEGKRARNSPSHTDILKDLENKKAENPKLYKLLFELIQKIYACEEIKERDYGQVNFTTGFPTDLILFVIKWFFIEQDITYWNFSGRAMFMSKIPMP